MWVWVVAERGALTSVKSLDFSAPLPGPAVSTPPGCTQAVGRRCVRNLASAHHTETDWLFVCVWVEGMGIEGVAEGTCTPHRNFTLWNSNYSSPPPGPPTGNHALSKQAAGVRGKAISTTGWLLMDCRVCWNRWLAAGDTDWVETPCLTLKGWGHVEMQHSS